MRERTSQEGRIVGQGDAGFHAPILGADRLPPGVLEQLREQARRVGLTPALVQR